MNQDHIVRHRAVLAAHKAHLDEAAARGKVSIPGEEYAIIGQDLNRFQAECPGLAPQFDPQQLVVQRIGNVTMVGVASLRAQIGRTLAILDASVKAPSPWPMTQRGFLSHAAADRKLAKHFRMALEAGAPGVEYFLASHRGQIPTGDSWCSAIFDNLREADRVAILLTPRSVRSLWVAFEAGAAWRPKPYPLVLFCVGISVDEVPTPFSELQLQFLDGDDALDRLLDGFEQLGSKAPQNALGFLEKMREAAEPLEPHEAIGPGLVGSNVGARFVAWAGPLDDCEDRPGVRLTEKDLGEIIEALREKNLHPSFRNLDRLGAREASQVFVVSAKGWKRPILYEDGQQVLVVRARDDAR